jgi:hypothetical protein
MKNRHRFGSRVLACAPLALFALLPVHASALDLAALGAPPLASVLPNPDVRLVTTYACEPGTFTSAILKGTGADCSTANFLLAYNLGHAASDDCAVETGFGYCNLVETVTKECTQKLDGSYVTKGYATYNCINVSPPD